MNKAVNPGARVIVLHSLYGLGEVCPVAGGLVFRGTYKIGQLDVVGWLASVRWYGKLPKAGVKVPVLASVEPLHTLKVVPQRLQAGLVLQGLLPPSVISVSYPVAKLLAAKPVVKRARRSTGWPNFTGRVSGKRVTHGRKVVQLRDDDHNADNSTDADAHDFIAGERRLDEDGQEFFVLSEKIDPRDVGAVNEDILDADGNPTLEIEPAIDAADDPLREAAPVAVEVRYQIAPGITLTKTVPLSNRDRQRKLSRRQRQLHKALKAFGRLGNWDEVAKTLGVTRSQARAMRMEISNMLGEDAVRIVPDCVRDPHTKRFVSAARSDRRAS